MFNLLRRLRSAQPRTHPAHPSGGDAAAGQGVPVTPPVRPPVQSLSGFWIEVEPFHPYRPKLHGPAGLVKFLSYEEAWRMVWEQHYDRLMRREAIRF